MKLKSMHIAIIVMVFVFGGIAATSALGLWQTTNDKVPNKYKEGDFEGQYNPEDIRGSYSFEDIYNSFKVPIEDLAEAFGVQDPDKFASFQCKELESLYEVLKEQGTEIGTGSVRYFVALYKGLDINLTESTYLPKSAVEVLKTRANLTDEQLKEIEKYSVDLSNISTATPTTTPVEEKTTVSGIVKGNTTFKELLGWGVSKEDIEKVINDKLPNSDMIIKDYATAKGIEFSTIKEPLQSLIDNI